MFVFIVILLTAVQCGQNQNPITQKNTEPDVSEVIATVNGQNITDHQVKIKAFDEYLGQKNASKTYEIKKEITEELIDEILLENASKAKGLPVEKFLDAEMLTSVKAPSEAEIKALYEGQKNSSLKGQSYNDAKESIKNSLLYNRKKMAYNDFMNDLRKSAKIEIFIARPTFNVSVDDDPGQGNPKAPIKFIEFSEYQCPYCRKARPAVNQILKTYGDKIYYVFRDYPLPFHKSAMSAATAANCAHEQKKYWEYGQQLWDNQNSLARLNTDKDRSDFFEGLAKKVGLNQNQFTKCYQSNRYDAEIQKDMRDAQAVGVSGTPSYFINGKFISGALPFAKFKEIIDEELEALGKK